MIQSTVFNGPVRPAKKTNKHRFNRFHQFFLPEPKGCCILAEIRIEIRAFAG